MPAQSFPPATALRRFNRAWSQRVGVLSESFLGLGRPLGPTRLLHEIGLEGATVIDLRARLGLDSGHLSRQLSSLVDDGLVRLEPDATDRRRRIATLTARGRREWERLEHRSEELAKRLVAPLSPRQRERLTEALATAELLLRAATADMATVDPASSLAQAAMARYVDELDQRFPGGFDPGDTSTTDAVTMSAPHGVFLVAASDGSPIACGGVQSLGDGVAEVKRMWVDPAWRGAGLGSRMLALLEEEGRRLGHHTMRLDTHGVLTDAAVLYLRAGYRPIARYNHNPYAEAWFEKSLA
ncbi:helix-turn-helix domain-containing GNAT family N-acetyltransferase [Nocardioides sp.]|uniref:bifunctional helix-turn-helix transcriptional regulator/GNAT family N-acetyltransferase n=1 Tax=Nocardioides sp. TaxID=35761 RepID=UPI00273429F7|nr:helix-turn-helix domain-containing GNAT family N-acetyltransferase [Nocardioides sp.]MDP3894179.1 helix-turn-helix domain-containing GNAT family N-acetyltransferase [Nocardioides sp.]